LRVSAARVAERCSNGPSWRSLAAILAAFATPAAVKADPCHAIPDKGPLPAYLAHGSRFSGPVVYVGDGDGLCVDVGAHHQPSGSGPGASWVEVRLADFYAPELHDAGGQDAKAKLEEIALGRRVECLADHRSYDRVVALCRLGGRSLGDLMRAVGAVEGGSGFRR
jgi:endonuclease YncB( thermonuclease family)